MNEDSSDDEQQTSGPSGVATRSSGAPAPKKLEQEDLDWFIFNEICLVK